MPHEKKKRRLTVPGGRGKQAERVGKLTAAYRKWELEHPELKTKTAGEIRSLGIIEGTLEEKNLYVPKWLPHKKPN